MDDAHPSNIAAEPIYEVDPTDILAEPRLAALREPFAILLIVVLADLCLYRGFGYSGYAVFFIGSAVLAAFATCRPGAMTASVIVALLLAATAGSMVWSGDVWQLCSAAGLLAAWTMAISGRPPYVLDVMARTVMSLPSGLPAIAGYLDSGRQAPKIPRQGWLKVVLPVVAVLGFGFIFLVANPDEFRSVTDAVQNSFTHVFDWFVQLDLSISEVLVWSVTAVAAAGLFRSLLKDSVLEHLARRLSPDVELSSPPSLATATATEEKSPLYAAYRNTLVAVCVLFAAYLLFEFFSLGFREFPEGFHYSGYAHQGAAWLTVALALATLMLSAMFRGAVLRDPRLPGLRRMAWVWSIENMLLAVAVYNRMSIYIDFNGMTRMRTVGELGITAVVAGLALVLWKITHERDLIWLLRRQLWVLAIAGVVYAVLPVDYLVHRYNVRRILAGDPAPSVQIMYHPSDDGGMLALIPLVDAPEEIIRDGVRAMLAERAAELSPPTTGFEHVTGYQATRERLRSTLSAINPKLKPYSRDSSLRHDKIRQLREYAYQWY